MVRKVRVLKDRDVISVVEIYISYHGDIGRSSEYSTE